MSLRSPVMYNPDLFEKSNELTYGKKYELLNEYKGRLKWKPREKVLDVGCGPGGVTSDILAPLLPPDVYLTGCDVSEKMVDYAREKHGSDRREFVVADISAKDIFGTLKEGSFDKVFSMYCLMQVADRRQTAENIYKLLSNGGEALIIDLVDHPLLNVYKYLATYPQWATLLKDYRSRISPYMFQEDAEEQCEKDFRRMPFKKVEVTTRNHNYIYPSGKLRDYASSVNLFTSKLPEEMRNKLIDDEVKILLDPEYPFTEILPDGKIEMRTKMMVEYLQK